ncbi:DUF4179 domain-containing protein [Bacillus sp. ISL-45]|uniref:DUF4179 domain-containing protein n=1 Tax=Bacillus sp. ISL-45 TaxID=2819128 RepID=UPI001BE574CF|nr:DUF4179 domain-containing protein [Bacillus sp. ISL-45]MBT2663420.1 DUF4179 domain-containing protein [Bacillus sp. ISL-45]
MSRQFPDLKNEMDQISVPVEKLDNIIEQTVSETKMKKPKKRIVWYSMSAAVVGFGLFIGSAMVSPAMAKVASNIPVVGTFFNDIGDEGLKIAGQNGLTQVVDQTAKDNGITLTINEVFYDGTRLTLGYTQESLLPLGELERPVIKADGKDINFSSGFSGEFITPQKYKGVVEITPTEELPEQFDMKVQFDAVGLVPGIWSFQFPVRQSNEVKVIRLSEVLKLKGAELNVDSLKVGPAGTVLNMNVIADSGLFDPHNLEFYLIDDKGSVINFLNGRVNGETVDGKEYAALQRLYEPLDDRVRRVKVIPYRIEFPLEDLKEESVKLDNIQLPFTMSQGEFGEIIITDIDYTDNRTIVYYDVKSEALLDNYASMNPLWIEDSNGKKLILDEKPFAERIKDQSFKKEFDTGKKKGLTLKTRHQPLPEMFEGFEIEIPEK